MYETSRLAHFFKGKRVFLTGHTGFKGSWLLAVLHTLGANVKGFSLAPATEPNLFGILQGEQLCTSVLGDIRDKEHLQEEIHAFKPDIIFHLAAQALVRASYENPVETFESNVLGTLHVVEAMRHLQNQCIMVCITTDKVYDNKEWIYPYRENDRLGGHDPYSASKAASELLISSYSKSFFSIADLEKHKKAIATVRAGNVIGGGDWSKDRILPDIVKALREEKPILLRNPNAVRPWQHVLEPLFGYLLLAYQLDKEPLKYQGSWNFGPMLEDNLSVEQITQMAIEIWGKGSYLIEKQGNNPHEAKLLRLDTSKARQELNWNTQITSKQAIRDTLAWYKTFYEGKADIKAYTLDAIKKYLEANCL